MVLTVCHYLQTRVYIEYCCRVGMKQKLVFEKKQVTIQKPQTLRSVLEQTMIERGMDVGLLDKISSHLIFSVDNIMVRGLDTIVKIGQTVRLIPAIKAG